MTTAALSAPRSIFISGATDGIGRHTAKKLASDGNHLLVHGRSDVGKKLCQELLDAGAVQATYFKADLNDLSEVERLASEIKDYCSCNTDGTLDVLINNAGVFDPPLPAKSAQGYDQTLAVNVLAPFLLTRRLLPLVAASTDSCPRIITTSSISQSGSLSKMNELFAVNNEPVSAHRAYSDSKLCDRLFTEQLAKLLTSQKKFEKIKCLTMDPGTVNTKMLLAGWGPCGIPVSRANNTYKLATEYGKQQESGSANFGIGGYRRSSDNGKELWKWLEKTTQCTYSDIDNL